MLDELWSEIRDAPGEIYDIPDSMDLHNELPNTEKAWNDYINSNRDF